MPLADNVDWLQRSIGLPAARNLRVITVASGKGGVGKTSVAVNLGVACAMAGLRSLLLDADLGLANADVLLGLQPARTVAQVLRGQAGIEEIVLDGPGGLQVIPGASGIQQLAELSRRELAGLVSAFSSLPVTPEVLIIDAAAGIASDVVHFCQAAHHVLVVVCDEPASITDGYALIKVLRRDYGIRGFRILANRARDAADGRALFNRLERVCDRYLDADLIYAGWIPDDARLRDAVYQRRAVVEAYPGAPSSLAFKKLVAAADKWPVANGLSGTAEFFAERLAAGSRPA